jgi:hypothetical protein
METPEKKGFRLEKNSNQIILNKQVLAFNNSAHCNPAKELQAFLSEGARTQEKLGNSFPPNTLISEIHPSSCLHFSD